MRVLVAAHDARVRRALSRLLELDGNGVVATTDSFGLLPRLQADLGPDVVVLDLDRHQDPRDVWVVEELSRCGRAVVAVCNGRSSCAGALAAGARACLDTNADFPDRLAAAVRAVAG
jgi:DNA-binding NarL/FixJ family response regulator